MVRSRYLRDIAVLAALAGTYFVAGKLGLYLASVHASATAVWPCTGIALAAFLIFGFHVWPAILAGAVIRQNSNRRWLRCCNIVAAMILAKDNSTTPP